MNLSSLIVLLLCLKFVKFQHPWQKVSSSPRFCSTVSCGKLARVLLALPQFVLTCSIHPLVAFPGGKHGWQHHDGGGEDEGESDAVGVQKLSDGEGGGDGDSDPGGVREVSTHTSLNSQSSQFVKGLSPCTS